MKPALEVVREPVLSRLQDLILEKAKLHPNISVRSFLIKEKKFSVGQYKKAMDYCPSNQWKYRTEELQNEIAAVSIQNHVQKAAELNAQFVTAANLSLAKTLQKLSKPDINSKEILTCTTAIHRSQEILCRALGVQAGDGLAQLLSRIPPREERTVVPCREAVENEKKLKGILDQLSYDDIKVFCREKIKQWDEEKNAQIE